MALILLFCFALLLHGALGQQFCEEMPLRMCPLSVSSAGKRCILQISDKTGELHCRTSDVFHIGILEPTASDECIAACMPDIDPPENPLDFLQEPHFTAKLCSKSCLNHCPNVIALYSNFALGQGVFLSDFCEAQLASPRRGMYEHKSSSVAAAPHSAAAFGQVSADATSYGPTSSIAGGPAHSDTFESGQISAVAYSPTPSNAVAPAYADAY